MSIFALNDLYSKTGNGGNAGRQTINVREVRGKLDLTTCRGNGGAAAANGMGGSGWFPFLWLHSRPFWLRLLVCVFISGHVMYP